MTEVTASVPKTTPFDGAAAENLPRLLYVGDVPVERTFHGSVVLYRLLQQYPPDKLRVIEAKPFLSDVKNRLPGVEYRQLTVSGLRWVNTRFSRLARTWMAVRAPSLTSQLKDSIEEFHPQAILTVAHGYSWLTAARLAAESSLPLHLIVHDDLLTTTPVLIRLSRWRERQFGRVYRTATSRLCVSPFMEQVFRDKYGVSGEVFYPSRAKDLPFFDQPPPAYSLKKEPLVGAFAGNIFRTGDAQLIASLARCLRSRGGQLLLFGPHSKESLRRLGLVAENILPQGMVPDLIGSIREKADFVFVPMDFHPARLEAIQLSFPSKLVDYTATGLPLLICAPQHSSVVQWALGQGPVAEVVTSEDEAQLIGALERLADFQHRKALGLASLSIGHSCFSHRAATNIFANALLRRVAR